MILDEKAAALLDKAEVIPTPPEPYKEPVKPFERLEHALQVIPGIDQRNQIRQLYWNELRGMSIFWDEAKREIEFVTNGISITVHATE